MKVLLMLYREASRVLFYNSQGVGDSKFEIRVFYAELYRGAGIFGMSFL